MIFHSEQFLLFFPVVFVIYWMLRNDRLRKICLLIASCLFYMSWKAYFLFLILFTASIDFFAARILEKNPELPFDPKRCRFRKTVLIVSVLTNLLLLIYFKYSNFFIGNVCGFLHQLGFHTHKPVLEIILPLGISFYTFETISYIVDVYLGRIKACSSFLNYAIFIMFFPHLIAGPIVRAADFLPQLNRTKRFTWTDLSFGAHQFLLGLFKKIVIADNLATLVDPVFANPSNYSTGTAWLAALCYTVQIFCDFSGYSDMAIGLARMLGYRLKVNFNQPYLALDMVDFWRRWHISLSTWMRDYVFIPLGGSRTGDYKKYGNLFATMIVCGFWHGADWQFILWGAYHGSLLLINHLLKSLGLLTNLSKFKFIAIPITFFFVLIGWVLFRAENLSKAAAMYKQMFLVNSGCTEVSAYVLTMISMGIAFFLLGQWLAAKTKARSMNRISGAGVAISMTSLLLGACILRPEKTVSFIYFQF